MGIAVSSKTDYCLQFGANTESKVKSLFAGTLLFSGLGLSTVIRRPC